MKEDGSVCACKSESLFHFLILFYFDFIFKRNISNIKDVTCTMWLTTQSTIFSHVGILALLPWNFTGNVLSKFVVCLII